MSTANALAEARNHLDSYGYIPEELLSRIPAEEVANLIAERSAADE